MKIKLLIYFFLIFNSTYLFATNIRVVDMELLINNNSTIKEIILKIENDQVEHRNKFKLTEEELKSKLEKIEELRLILDSEELDKEIYAYNEDFNIFNNKIEQFNNHYDNQLNNFKNLILTNIIELLKQYSNQNKIDLILDSKSYIISSNSINITEVILSELNNIEFEINFEKYK